jgi:hypothetical protein
LKKFIFMLLLSFPLFLGCVSFAYTISDTGGDAYWGGSVSGASSTAYGDVIGSPYFNVDQMNVENSGKDWTVTLVGPYFGYHNNSTVDGGLPYRFGPGDLYINSNGWIASQGPAGHYETDTFAKDGTEGWNFIVTRNAQGQWGLYSLDYSKIQYTNAGSGYIYRIDQAWQGGAGNYIGAASRNYDPQNNKLTFAFNTGDMDWTNAGFHWTMQCGNDVLEGAAPVPEPSTMLLLGTGLVGLLGIRKKRKEHSAKR